MAGEFQQARQRIAEHRAAAVADVHRAGGIGRDIFDIDLLDRAHPALRRATIVAALRQCGAQHGPENMRLQADVDEAGTGDLGLRDVGVFGKREGDLGGELARIAETALGFFGEDHGGVDGEIAERGLARRLDHETGEIEVGGQAAGLGEASQDRCDAGVKIGENVHGAPD